MPQATSIVSRGLRLHLDVYPAASSDPAIIFAPGTGRYAAQYEAFLCRLNDQGFQVVGLDPQGHGRSDGEPGDFTLDELVQNLRDALSFALAELSPSVGLLGSSQGALTVLYTIAADDRAASAVCHNAAILNERAARAIRTSRLSRTLRSHVPHMARVAPRARLAVRRYLKLETIFDDVELGRKLDEDPRSVRTYTLRALASLASARLARPVQEITTPTMFLAAENDRIFPMRYVRSVFDRLTCPKEFVIVPETGHMLFIEYVEQAWPPVADWFDRTLRQGRPR